MDSTTFQCFSTKLRHGDTWECQRQSCMHGVKCRQHFPHIATHGSHHLSPRLTLGIDHPKVSERLQRVSERHAKTTRYRCSKVKCHLIWIRPHDDKHRLLNARVHADGSPHFLAVTLDNHLLQCVIHHSKHELLLRCVCGTSANHKRIARCACVLGSDLFDIHLFAVHAPNALHETKYKWRKSGAMRSVLQ